MTDFKIFFSTVLSLAALNLGVSVCVAETPATPPPAPSPAPAAETIPSHELESELATGTRVPADKSQEAINFLESKWLDPNVRVMKNPDLMFMGEPAYLGSNLPGHHFANGLICADVKRKIAFAAVQVSIPTTPKKFAIFLHPEVEDPFHYIKASEALAKYLQQPASPEWNKFLEARAIEGTAKKTLAKAKMQVLLAEAPASGKYVDDRKALLNAWVTKVGRALILKDPLISKALNKTELEAALQAGITAVSDSRDIGSARRQLTQAKQELEDSTKTLEGLRPAVAERETMLAKLRAPFEADFAKAFDTTVAGKDAEGQPLYNYTKKVPFFVDGVEGKMTNKADYGRMARVFGQIKFSKMRMSIEGPDTVYGQQIGSGGPLNETVFKWFRPVKGQEEPQELLCY